MALALEQAREAMLAGEVPVGAVVVKDGIVLATGRNRTIEWSDPSAHAEVVALREAARILGTHRLNDVELFVTLEPCAMCSGAIFHSRLSRLVYGAKDPKTGCAGSVTDLFASRQLNHHTAVLGNVLGETCSVLLQSFFHDARRKRAAESSPLRDDALRTPEDSFAGLEPMPMMSGYFYSHEGLRMHWWDSGNEATDKVVLCLHDFPFWSYQFSAWMPKLLKSGGRFIIPDLIGCGLSDKPKKQGWHQVHAHERTLLDLCRGKDLMPTHILAVGTGCAIAQTVVRNAGWENTKILNVQFSKHAANVENGRSHARSRDSSSGFVRALDVPALAPFPNKGYAAILQGMAHPTFSTSSDYVGELLVFDPPSSLSQLPLAMGTSVADAMEA